MIQTPATLHHWMSGKRESFFAYLRLLLELLQMTGLLMGMGSFEPQWLVVRARPHHPPLKQRVCYCVELSRVQVTISAFSGAAVGAGFSVTTWAPWVCVIGDNIVTQMWVQLILALCALPMALGIAALSVPLSRIIWKGVLEHSPKRLCPVT